MRAEEAGPGEIPEDRLLFQLQTGGGGGGGGAERQAGEGEQAAVDFTYSKTSHLGETSETTGAGQG